MVQLSYPYMTTGKIIALTRWVFVGKVMSLLSNVLSRFVSFSSKHQAFFNFMTAVTICQNPKDSTQKLIREISKVAGYKINIHKCVAFLYSNNFSERENLKKIPFRITSKKYLGINLTEEVKDLYAKTIRH